jgi:DNA-binding NtrC family response regulator
MANILICMDEEEMTRHLKGRLVKEGHEIQIACKALDAVRKLLTGKFDIFILHTDMARGTGACLVTVVNSLDDSIPVITLTRQDSLELQRRTRRGKVFFHAVWPQDIQAISSAVNDAHTLRAKRYTRDKDTFKTISPCYLKRRIAGYIV